MLKHSIVSLFISLFLMSCSMDGSMGKEYWIDNPTANEITVQIDETNYVIPSESGMNVFLNWGKHKLTYNNESLNFFVKSGSPLPAFINPTQSNYINNCHVFIVQEDSRATDDYIEWLSLTNGDSVSMEINGERVKEYVSFSVQNDVFIDAALKSWDYFINEDVPDNVVLSRPIVTKRNRSLLNDKNYKEGPFQTTKQKLYREQDFLNYMKKFTDEEIKFCMEKKAYSDYTPMKVKLTTLDAIKDPEYKNYMIDLQNKTNEWLQMTDPKKVNELQDELMGVKANVTRNKMRSEYLEKYKGDHNDNLQKLDYSFNAATNEYGDQTSVSTKRSSVGISIINVLIVE